MNSKDYIASGILELYVAGSLSEKENQEVYEAMQKYPDVLAEVESIENAIIQLTALAKKDDAYLFDDIKNQLNVDDPKVIPISKPTSNWKQYLGWAAAFILGSTLILSVLQNNKLKSQLVSEKELLEAQIDSASTNLAAAEKLIEIFRDKDIISVPLAGQTVSPTSYAKVYWDKKTNSIYLDAKGLPEPPKGKVYQVWSLKLSPLTPTSLGTLDSFTADANKIFTITNANESEAFGITLEPAGGSLSPTLEQLYTLGAVSS
ncbi:anti-sigma factor [Polaribacter reichenbachii]|uniref:Anti-sigma factor n=1 Tax=Polaribacter reichenbachii TaxID=996801 RepID=A0A1B8TZU5_9FLAO|nr:anti-sigma factor [Polaribacter reichenbachii]APZ47176.1 anti-sigma factor [Polaribacter reichenbachii]AUC17816.1 anti-sigma factor [Polaribacter reichenbachii]OBY65160.1 anti-sigma factor [Polaribacter reichenbachii]